jgi:hypothetical protein
VRPGRDADPSPPSSAEVKNGAELIPLLSLRTFVTYERVKPTYLGDDLKNTEFRNTFNLKGTDQLENPEIWKHY